MKPKTIILMVVAVTCGLGASYMTSRLLAERQSSDENAKKVAVLVAKKNLDNGMMIKNPEELFSEKLYNEGDEPKNAITKMDDLKLRQLRKSLRKDDFITPDELLDIGSSALQSSLPKGHRAVGIRVNMESIAGGWASLPQSKVDIVHTMRRPDDKTSFSQLLLQNVLVLGVDTTDKRPEGNQALPGSVVVVALKPDDVLKLNIAKEFGTLSLALRGFGETKIEDTPKHTVDQVVNAGIKSGGEDITDAELGSTGQPGLAVPTIPINPKGGETVSVDPPKQYAKHSILIIEGDKERTVDFPLDDNGKVVRVDVVQTPVVVAPPEVVAPQPTPPAPVPPAPIPPKGNRPNND